MKSKEELLNLKSEMEELGKKLSELDSEELEFVTGGVSLFKDPAGRRDPAAQGESVEIVY